MNLTDMEKEELIRFLISYGGFESSDMVVDYVNELPLNARELAINIKNRIADDKDISIGSREFIKSFHF